MPALNTYRQVQSNLFVRLQVDQYKASSGDSYSAQVLRFSDLRTGYTINDEVYTGVGNLMSVTSSTSELRSSSAQLSITLTGIPSSAIAEIMASKIKGSPIRIYRVMFDPVTGDKLDLPVNPLTRYRGFVNNFSLQETYDPITRTSVNTIILICSSSVDVLANKYAGRKTNPQSNKKYFPDDISMDRVPTLQNSTFNFGAPK